MCIPKTHKSDDAGRLPINHVRPISVLSVFWRAYSSAWTSSHQLQNWTKRSLHAQVAHGKGMLGCEDLIGDMLELMATKTGVLTTLDFSQAFDHMNPKVSCKALPVMGFPQPLAALLDEVWCFQKRWLQYQDHTAEARLDASQAMPQGDPMAPLLMAVWVSSGLRAIEATRLDEAVYSCYMDDRTFWTSNVSSALDRIEAWQQWSSTVGVRENINKTQMVAKTRAQRAELLALAPAWAKDEIKVLGASTVTQVRKLTEDENSRLAEVFERSRLIARLPLSWSRRIQAFHAFVLSKACYGWIGKSPNKDHSEKPFTCLTKALDTQKMGARALKKMFFGANTDLSQVLTSRRIARMHRYLAKKSNVSWHCKPFTATAVLRKDLQQLGFKESRPWVWRVNDDWRRFVPAEERTLDLRPATGQKLAEQLHVGRQAYGRRCLDEFLAHPKRRDSRALTEQHSDAALKQSFAEVNLTRTRRMAEETAAYRSVFLAAFASTACQWHGWGQEDVPGCQDLCPFCRFATGSHERQFWDCPANPCQQPPTNTYSRRFGWVTNSDSAKEPAHLQHMAATVARVWGLRYPDASSRGSQ